MVCMLRTRFTDGLLLVLLDFYPRNLVYGTPNFLDRSQFNYFFLHQMTHLHSAAKIGHIKVLGYLVEKGADINIQADNGVIIRDSAARIPD